MTSDEIGRAVVAARAWRAAPAAGAAKPSNIDKATDDSSDATPAPVPAVAQPAPAVPPPSAALQPAPSNITVLPAPAKIAPAAPAKSAKRDDLLDQVPQGLRKRFGF
jgi:hypothetical protein